MNAYRSIIMKTVYSLISAILFFLMITAMFTMKFYAQENTGNASSFAVSFPSPTPAALGKYGDIPVSLYTGVPEISIPLYKATSRTLSLDIKLTYHAGGNKPQEVPGWTGVGWSLDAGGVITRTVMGKPDEINYFIGGGGYADYKGTDYNYVYKQVARGVWDAQPDKYFFNFAGHSGEFYFTPDGIKILGKCEKMKIDGRPDSKFTITTEDGIKYIFEVCETTSSYITSWWLTKIVSPIGNDMITLTYAGPFSLPSVSVPWNEETVYQIGPNAFDNAGDGGRPTQAKRLSSIVAGRETINFDMSDRSDGLDKKLNNISIYVDGNLIKNFNFSYTDNLTERLLLNSLQESGPNNSTLPSYQFTYCGPKLPASYEGNFDHWGYYNACNANQNDMMPAVSYLMPPLNTVSVTVGGVSRETDPSCVRAELLTGISYPTGGSTNFDYESHDYGNASDGSKKIVAGGVRIKRITQQDAMGGQKIKEYKYITSADPDRSSGMLVEDIPIYVKTYIYTYYDSYCGLRTGYDVTRSNFPRGGNGLTQGSPVGYSEVLELLGPNGTYGQSKYVFKALNGPPKRYLLWSPHITNDWNLGQLLCEYHYNSSGILQSTKGYNYTYTLEGVVSGFLASYNSFQTCSLAPNGNTNPFIYVISNTGYQEESGLVQLSSETTTNFDQNGQNPIAFTKQYFYENPSHLQVTRIVETNSDGKRRVTKMRYPLDYTNTSGSSDLTLQALNSMQNANMQNAVIEKWVTDSMSANTVFSGQLTLYRLFGTQILPYQKMALSAAYPITDFASAYVQIQNSTFNFDPRYSPFETYTSYDQYGHLLSGTDANGNQINLFYGSNTDPFNNNATALMNCSLTGIQRYKNSSTCLQTCAQYRCFRQYYAN